MTVTVPPLSGPLHVVTRGEVSPGPVVVLVHGSMDRSAGFARVIGQLDGHRVLRYDRRGYGRSREAGPPVGIDGHVDDLLAVLGAHASGRPAVAIGHSYGGVVALTAAARHPDVVVAVGSFEAPLPWLPWWPTTTAGAVAVAQANAGEGRADGHSAGDAAEAFLRRMLGEERWAGLPAVMQRDRRLEGPALVAELESIRTGHVPFDLEHLQVPVVAGWGTRSGDHRRRAAEHLAACTGGSVFVIEGAQHGAHLSHPTEFATFVRAVLALATAP